MAAPSYPARPGSALTRGQLAGIECYRRARALPAPTEIASDVLRAIGMVALAIMVFSC